jgi:hypothetical protein
LLAKKVSDFFHDYGALIAPTAAILNGFIAVLVAQFFKDHRRAKVLLVIAAGVLGSAAISATFYAQHQIVAERDAAIQKNKEIRERLGALIQEGASLIVGCSDNTKQPPTAAVDAWLHKVEDFLNTRLGHSYVARILVPTSATVNLTCNGANKEYDKLVHLVLGVNFHLEQFGQQSNF